jgi:hypothetical protein
MRELGDGLVAGEVPRVESRDDAAEDVGVDSKGVGASTEEDTGEVSAAAPEVDPAAVVRDSLLRTAALTEVDSPVSTRAFKYSSKARSDFNSGD